MKGEFDYDSPEFNVCLEDFTPHGNCSGLDKKVAEGVARFQEAQKEADDRFRSAYVEGLSATD